MQALLETLLRIAGDFDPITSAQVLAILGAVALVLGFAYLITRAGTAAAAGTANVINGLRILIAALAWSLAAILILYLAFCLANGTLTHILR